MTTVEDLKKEKRILKDKREFLFQEQREKIKQAINKIKEEYGNLLDKNLEKIQILDRQIKNMRMPDIAKNVKRVRSLIR